MVQGEHKLFNVLFLCTGNSARSIMAEAVLRLWGRGKFNAYSAGSHPAGQVNPRTIELLAKRNFLTADLRSKSWDEFAAPGAPKLDFVFTVCDQAAAEVCPVWPGQPISAHWGVPDPAAVSGDDRKIDRAFLDAFLVLEARIKLFTALPIASLDRLALQERVDRIGTGQDKAS
jgi:protein-tyrosine-phosphatase